MVASKALTGRVPPVTAGVIVLATAATFWPDLGEWFVYDRPGVLGGEMWRLVTAPLVHFSPSHLWWDIAVFGAAGWGIEASGARRFGWFCAATAAVTGFYSLYFAPDLSRYGGLSGLAIAAVVGFAVQGLRDEQGCRWPYFLLLGLVAGKMIAEAAVGPLFAAPAGDAVPVFTAAHLIGVGAGCFLGFRRAPSLHPRMPSSGVVPSSVPPET